MTLRAIALVATLVVLAACSGGDSVEAESAVGEIVFTVNRGGRNEIWLMAADGRERRRHIP